MRRFFVTLAMIAIVLAPFGASANDRQIAEQIVRSLKQRKAAGELQGFNIDLQVDKGAVWLKGYVSKPEQEQLALEIARSVDGVEKVFNRIELRSEETVAADSDQVDQTQQLATASHEASTAAVGQPEIGTTQLVSAHEEIDNGNDESRRIAQSLVAKLRDEQRNGNLERFGIDIHVDKGVLRLKGQLSSEIQRHTVLEIARRIPGVKKVVNELTIDANDAVPVQAEEAAVETPTAIVAEAKPVSATSRRHSDTAPIATVKPKAVAMQTDNEFDGDRITEEVLKRLATQKNLGVLRDFGIDVEVEQGVVWMSGYVANEEQQALALNMARYVNGVKQVVNDLRIEAPQEESTVQFVAHPIHADRSAPVEPQDLQPLRPTAEPQAATAQAASQLPNGMSYVPTNANSQVAGWALVNVGGNQPQATVAANHQLQMPMAFAPARPVNYNQMQAGGQPQPMMGGHGVGVAPARYDHPQLPGYAWPSYAAHPNYGAVSYPQQYSAQAWPYIGPFYPYPQVPLGWRKVTLEWDDGWWQLDFKDRH